MKYGNPIEVQKELLGKKGLKFNAGMCLVTLDRYTISDP